jgi:hypothetical protein
MAIGDLSRLKQRSGSVRIKALREERPVEILIDPAGEQIRRRRRTGKLLHRIHSVVEKVRRQDGISLSHPATERVVLETHSTRIHRYQLIPGIPNIRSSFLSVRVPGQT